MGRGAERDAARVTSPAGRARLHARTRARARAQEDLDLMHFGTLKILLAQQVRLCVRLCVRVRVRVRACVCAARARDLTKPARSPGTWARPASG